MRQLLKAALISVSLLMSTVACESAKTCASAKTKDDCHTASSANAQCIWSSNNTCNTFSGLCQKYYTGTNDAADKTACEAALDPATGLKCVWSVLGSQGKCQSAGACEVANCATYSESQTQCDIPVADGAKICTFTPPAAPGACSNLVAGVEFCAAQTAPGCSNPPNYCQATVN